MTTPETETTPSETQNNIVPLPQPEVQSPEPVPAHRKVVNFVQEHPIASIAGGLAIGAIAAALIPRKNRNAVTRNTSLWASTISAASTAIAQQALSQIEAAASGMRSQAHTFAERAENAGHSAYDTVERVGHASLDKARSALASVPDHDLTKKVNSAAEKLKNRLHR